MRPFSPCVAVECTLTRVVKPVAETGLHPPGDQSRAVSEVTEPTRAMTHTSVSDSMRPPLRDGRLPQPKGLIMGLLTKPIRTLDDLFVHTLQDIYYAEQQITKALPKMISKVTNPELKQGFQDHLEQTRNHVTRVEQVFRMHGEQAKAVTCPAIDGIINEANDILGDAKDSDVLDAAAAAAAQAVEHYEIARYGTLIAWARELGRDDCAGVLEQTLEEEKAADHKLTEIAEARLNRQAAGR
jgi:ferritin-like metal-binding protein YciE